ncbi:MAG: AI-2E family transporter [Oscillospiraceae bacterium]|nr:AI-2E family transporter [Oscillospiraceae bacterium]
MKEPHSTHEQLKLFTTRILANTIVVCAGITFYMALANFNILHEKLRIVTTIVSPFTAGLVLAYLLNSPTLYFEETLFKKLRHKHLISIFLSYILALITVITLLGLIIPQIAQSISVVFARVPDYLENVNQIVLYLTSTFNIDTEEAQQLAVSWKDLITQITAWVQSVIPQLLGFSISVGNTIINGFVAFITSLYLLIDKDRLLRQARKGVYALLPLNKANRLLEVANISNRIFNRFIVGKLLDSLIIGIICFVGMSIFRFPYAMLISVIVGVTNIIPFFGPFIGAIPSVLILLMVSPWKALGFVFFVLALQQFDGNILGPKILGNSTGLSPIWVLMAIVISGGLFGFVGMVIGVPTFAVIYKFTAEYINSRLAKKNIDEEGKPLEAKDE